MRGQSWLGAWSVLAVFALAACGDDATGPGSTAEPSTATPELAVAHNAWVTRADMWSIERWQLAAATVSNAGGQSVVYAIGGRNATGDRSATGGNQSKVMAYNVATNTWTLKAPLPYPIYESNGAAAINGKIYISGGYADPNHFYPASWLFMYDAATNTWKRRHDMPDIGADGVTGVIDGKLYVLTQCFYALEPAYYDCDPSRLFRYDPATNHWTTLARPHSSLILPVGGVLYGKLYVLSTYTNELEAYDPATDRWTTKTPRPGERDWWGAGTMATAKLYVMGGAPGWNPDDSRSPVRTTSIYHPQTDTWTTGAPMPTAQWGVAASSVFLNGQPRIQVVGGSRPGNNQQYIP